MKGRLIEILKPIYSINKNHLVQCTLTNRTLIDKASEEYSKGWILKEVENNCCEEGHLFELYANMTDAQYTGIYLKTGILFSDEDINNLHMAKMIRFK